ncbi:hypothetical protein FRB91_001206 [Serendipita sp. 411]|nr:hypothetical protein FRB91_001206 [Serendipita sp. 411]
MDPSIIRSYEQMLENIKRDPGDAELVIDARPKARFMGSAPEPWEGLPSGHMPNSVSIPFTELLTTHEYPHDMEKLRQVLIDLLDPKERKGTGKAKGTEYLNAILRGEIPIVATCAIGMTACIIWLALHELRAFMHLDRGAEVNEGDGLMRIALYDESWTGYARRAESPIVVSAQ